MFYLQPNVLLAINIRQSYGSASKESQQKPALVNTAQNLVIFRTETQGQYHKKEHNAISHKPELNKR